ncbi:histidine phosphatase family protein [Nakamurella alba]|uniref:histidine phosphatase family protein n=1 Tax=Nakamurella alba TaxID=2665158 RepID=UPI0018A9C739|nr:histidine phosphatase family protein [Nakamurella alba]
MTAPVPETTVLLVRHGQTTWSAERRYAGREDPPLTGLGEQEAISLAERVSGLRPDVVYSSPLRRCRDTAARIAGRDNGVLVEPDLTDADLGAWTGLGRRQIQAGDPAAFARWSSSSAGAPPGGESYDQVLDRAVPVLRRVLAAHPGGTAALVTHSAVVKMLLTWALGVPAAVGFRLKVDTASLSALTGPADAEAGTCTVWAVNETGHLPGG